MSRIFDENDYWMELQAEAELEDFYELETCEEKEICIRYLESLEVDGKEQGYVDMVLKIIRR